MLCGVGHRRPPRRPRVDLDGHHGSGPPRGSTLRIDVSGPCHGSPRHGGPRQLGSTGGDLLRTDPVATGKYAGCVDALGIIRQLESDPALRAQLRAVLLGDEVLELPDLVRRLDLRFEQLVDAQNRTEARLGQLADAQNILQARVEQLADAQNRTEARLEQLVDAQNILQARVGQLADAQNRTEAELSAVASTQQEMLRWQHRADDQFGELKGAALESRLRQDPRRFVPRRMASAVRLVTDDRFDALLAGLDAGTAADVERADALIEGRLTDGTDVVFVVEAAWTAHVDDVDRAVRRARSLRQSGMAAHALVVSHADPDATVLAAAAERGAAVVGESSGLLVPVEPTAA